MLCCIGCAIFGVTEVSTDGIDFETGDFPYQNAEEGKMPTAAAGAAPPAAAAAAAPAYVPPPPQPEPTPPVAVTEPEPVVSQPENEPTTTAGAPAVDEPSRAEAPVDLLDEEAGKESSEVIHELD